MLPVFGSVPTRRGTRCDPRCFAPRPAGVGGQDHSPAVRAGDDYREGVTSEPTRLTLTVQNRRVVALTWGPPEGSSDAPLALLVHGYPDTPWTWRHVAPRLAAAGYRVVAPWTRGYAPSDPADDDRYDVPVLADDLIALHEALGGGPDAFLVGHDWGAVAACAVAAREHSPFGHIAVLSVPPLAILFQPRPRVGAWLRLAAHQLRLSAYVIGNQFAWRSEPHHPERVAHLWATWSPTYPAAEDLAHVHAATAGREREVLSYYRHIWRRARQRWWRCPRTPILYLHGAQDGCVDAAWAPRVGQALGADHRVQVIADAGHFLSLEAPEAVAEHLVAWSTSR